jgi:NAD(P)-dependent dehydrogenase (short-subunit alcohol dehydrogenase family)
MPYTNPPALQYHYSRLQDKVILIVGASSGIGEAGARLFVKEGATVMLAARRLDKLKAIASDIKSSGGKAEIVTCDVLNEEDVRHAVHFTIEKFGRIDCAFNNSGIAGGRGPIHTLKMEDFDGIMNVNLRGIFMCMKYEIAAMLQHPSPSGTHTIVNVSSGAGLSTSPGNSIYSASKFGLGALTRTAALDYATKGIRVNAIAPGPTRTEAFERMCPTEEMKEMMAGMFPMNYVAEADDMARMAVFLLGEESRWTTGCVLPCEGGRSVT